MDLAAALQAEVLSVDLNLEVAHSVVLEGIPLAVVLVEIPLGEVLVVRVQTEETKVSLLEHILLVEFNMKSSTKRSIA
jgi:hypothetical protein